MCVGLRHPRLHVPSIIELDLRNLLVESLMLHINPSNLRKIDLSGCISLRDQDIHLCYESPRIDFLAKSTRKLCWICYNSGAQNNAHCNMPLVKDELSYSNSRFQHRGMLGNGERKINDSLLSKIAEKSSRNDMITFLGTRDNNLSNLHGTTCNSSTSPSCSSANLNPRYSSRPTVLKRKREPKSMLSLLRHDQRVKKKKRKFL